MQGTPHEALVAFILSVDRAVLVYLIPVSALFATAAVSLLARGRRPLEIVALLILAFVAVMTLAWFVFHVLAHRPFFRLETVHYT